jgi:8-oxo-dGTP diphosphatase
MAKSQQNNDRRRVRVEHSAGGIVFRRCGRQILVGMIMDSYRKWTFPKGHVEKGESVSHAALRETREEMGLKRLRLVAPLGGISIWFKDRYEHVGETIHKYIDFFLMETAPEERGAPERRERVYAIRWVPYRQASKRAGYKNIQPVLKVAVAYLDEAQKRLTRGR